MTLDPSVEELRDEKTPTYPLRFSTPELKPILVAVGAGRGGHEDDQSTVAETLYCRTGSHAIPVASRLMLQEPSLGCGSRRM